MTQQGNLKIEIDINEHDFMESMLNMKHSGVTDNNLVLFISFYALAKSWHIDKLSYYLNLLEIKQW